MIIVVLIIVIFIYLLRQKNNFTELPYNRNILVITAEDRNSKFIEYHDINCEKYCKKNGYTYLRFDKCENVNVYWCKIHKVKEYLKDYDYVLWLDSDTVFTDNTPIDYYISLIGEPDIIISKDIGKDTHKNILNAGVFLIKNTLIGKNFIDDCLKEIDSKPWCIVNNKLQGNWAGECYEQGVMNYLLKGKYQKDYYLDNDQLFILNQIWPYQNFNKIPLILHLAGWPAEKRREVFSSFLNN